MCNVEISTVLLYCIVTLVRLSLVTNKRYLLTYFTSLSLLSRCLSLCYGLVREIKALID